MDTIIHTLGNGLRVVARRSDGNVAYIGILANAGSRDDGDAQDGLAHFVEHTIFKGTPSRRTWQVSDRMESVGGELNAYTTREEIMVYTNAPAGYERRASDLLADLVENAWFPENEIDLERGVILEEISSYRDNASYAVFDEFDELMFRDSPMAHNILGYPDTVRNISQADARGFLCRYFAPENMVVYCLAPGDPEKNIVRIERSFEKLERPWKPPVRTVPDLIPVFDETRDRGNHQANALVGTRIFDAHDPRRFALLMYANVIGGVSMNSVLNRELRERRGLVYSVECATSLYSDCGVFQVYFATEPNNVEKCVRVVRREIDRLATSAMSERSFRKAQRQLCGQLLVNGDNRESQAMALAKDLMRHGEILGNRYIADRIMELTPEDVRGVAELMATSDMSRLVLI